MPRVRTRAMRLTNARTLDARLRHVLAGRIRDRTARTRGGHCTLRSKCATCERACAANRPGANALLHLSWLLWILGYPEQALRNSEKAIATARQLGQPMALSLHCSSPRPRVRAPATIGSCGYCWTSLIALTDAHDLGYMGSCARVLEAQQLIAQDRGEAGIRLIERAFAEFRDQEAGVGLPWAMAILAEGHVRLSRPKEGLAVLTAARVTAARNGECHWLPELYRLHGELLLLPSGRDESAAEACFRDAISLSRAQAAKALELRAATSLARLLAGRDVTTDAHRLLTEAYQSFDEGFDTADLRAAANLLEDSKLTQPSAA